MPTDPASASDPLDDALPGADETIRGIERWLSRVGLGTTNPFELLDEGADPDLSRYLVRHDVFRTIWHDSPSIVLAPAGGGKSAFRVRLAYACRVEEDRRRVFPICYIAPRPTATSLEVHLQALLKGAAQELLLTLASRPGRLDVLDEMGKQRVRWVLDQNAPGLLSRFLPQLERAGSLAPLVEAFDPSAAYLLASPGHGAATGPDQIRALCAELERIAPSPDLPPAAQRFRDLVRLLLSDLQFEAIYLLVDGVDAFPETIDEPRRAMAVLQPLLDQMASWPEQKVFLKFFLPVELKQQLPQLTDRAKVAIIGWKSQALVEVLRARLRAASRGAFDSLDAISAPSLRSAEAELIQAVPPVPRELLVLMNQVLVEHVRRVGSNGRLEPEDVQAAIRWYRSQPQAPPP